MNNEWTQSDDEAFAEYMKSGLSAPEPEIRYAELREYSDRADLEYTVNTLIATCRNQGIKLRDQEYDLSYARHLRDAWAVSAIALLVLLVLLAYRHGSCVRVGAL